MEHHADFAVAIVQRLHVETRHTRPDGAGKIAGRAIALGWWVDAPGSPPSGEPAVEPKAEQPARAGRAPVERPSGQPEGSAEQRTSVQEPTGTLYLVVDDALPRPVWVAQGDLTAIRLED